MKLYNSKTLKIEEFNTLHENKLNMYVCGPTVYSDIHIGNIRPTILFDVLRNYYTAIGYDVNLVSNITDIDDKIIDEAIKLNITESELTKRTSKNYIEILNKLNINFNQMPMVTTYIDKIISYIENLVETGYAYVLEGDVYFNTSKIDNYGEISNRNIEEQQFGNRIDLNENKINKSDFVLWKKTNKGITFSSKFSNGRPGWHTECVVMINEIFEGTLDIHGGGVDLKFPHHENENAQACACKKTLANFWVHNGFVNVDNEKMSKSIGNTVLVKDLLSQYDENFVKMLFYQTNYRSPINLTDEFISNTLKLTKRLQKIRNKYDEIDLNFDLEDIYVQQLCTYLENDINTSNIISSLISWAKEDNLVKYNEAFKFAFYVLNFTKIINEIPQEVLELISKRNEHKLNREYELADKIRKQINTLGYDITDTREGVKCHKI